MLYKSKASSFVHAADMTAGGKVHQKREVTGGDNEYIGKKYTACLFNNQCQSIYILLFFKFNCIFSLFPENASLCYYINVIMLVYFTHWIKVTFFPPQGTTMSPKNIIFILFNNNLDILTCNYNYLVFVFKSL